MERVTKGLNSLLIFLFLLGIVVTAYMLFELPDRLIHAVDVLNINNIDQAASALNPVYITVALVLLTGMGIITINLMTRRSGINIQDARLEVKSAEEEDDKEDEKKETLAEESKKMVGEVKEIAREKGDQKNRFNRALAHICKGVEASQGVIYLKQKKANKNFLELFSAYAFSIAESELLSYEMGEGLIGQAAKDGKSFVVDSVPEGHIEIFSGLGNASPTNLFVVPLMKNNTIYGVAEISSFKIFNSIDQQIIKDSLGVLSSIEQEKTVSRKAPAKKVAKEPVKKEKKSGSSPDKRKTD